MGNCCIYEKSENELNIIIVNSNQKTRNNQIRNKIASQTIDQSKLSNINLTLRNEDSNISTSKYNSSSKIKLQKNNSETERTYYHPKSNFPLYKQTSLYTKNVDSTSNESDFNINKRFMKVNNTRNIDNRIYNTNFYTPNQSNSIYTSKKNIDTYGLSSTNIFSTSVDINNNSINHNNYLISKFSYIFDDKLKYIKVNKNTCSIKKWEDK